MEVLTVVLRLTELNFTFEVNTVFCRLDHSTTRRLNHTRHVATRYPVRTCQDTRIQAQRQFYM
jgi:hypothetical protein